MRSYGNHSPEIVAIVSMKNIPECSTSLFVPGPLGIAIVAIIWKLVRVRIAQLFGSDRNDHSDRSDHMETSLYLAP